MTGAPPGFSATVGALACQGRGAPGCAAPLGPVGEEGPTTGATDTYQLQLAGGRWSVAGDYSLSGPGDLSAGGDFTGPDREVPVSAGAVVTRNLTVPYVAPGTVLARST